MNIEKNHKNHHIWVLYLAKFVKILKICFVQSVPHNLNIHVIQILENNTETSLAVMKKNETKMHLYLLEAQIISCSFLPQM